MTTTARHLMLGITLVLILPVFTGCSSSQAPPSKEELASFKGVPMPPEARKKMQDAIEAAKNKAAQDASKGAQANQGK